MDIKKLQKLFRSDSSIHGWKQSEPFTLEKSRASYAAWQKQAKSNGLLPTEYLLPRIYCPCPAELPAFMLQADKIKPSDQLIQQRDELGPWGFWFKLAPGITTKKLDILGRNRITCRSHLITSTVEKFLGKRLPETTVLDIACHSGFFSLDIASRGVKHVTGVELRAININQAKFLQQHFGFKNISFEQADITAWQPAQKFSVVLNLGLLYHVIDPVTLVRQTYDWCEDFAVIDTICHPEPISAFIAAFNKDVSLHGEGKYSVELHPTYRALIDTMHDAGFVDLVELIADEGDSGKVSLYYRKHMRRCIIGFKRPMAEVLKDNGLG
jgi:SAM-dependent methyltransferase